MLPSPVALRLPCQYALADFYLPASAPWSPRDFSGMAESHPVIVCGWEIIILPGAAQGMFCTFSQSFCGRLGSNYPQR